MDCAVEGALSVHDLTYVNSVYDQVPPIYALTKITHLPRHPNGRLLVNPTRRLRLNFLRSSR